MNRRELLQNAGGGMGMLALNALLQQEQPAHAAANSALSSSKPDFPPRAKRIIWLFMHGGPSHVDLWDPKPDLIKYAGKPLPESFGKVMTRRKVAQNPLLAPIKPFRKRGESGLEVSDFLPHTGALVDDLCVIRSLHGDSVNHPQSVYQMNTGSILMGHPSVGSWVAYGLGSENADMPAFVVLPDPGGGVKGGPPAWGSGYLPATFQGTTMRPGQTPILNLKPPTGISTRQQRATLDLVQSLNRRHLEARDRDDELSARIAAYELAFRMQTAAPEIVDLTQETPATHKMYGLDDPDTRDFGERCLLARRMVERGVRFIQLYSGDTVGWDAHSDVTKNHTTYCRKTDQPIAALLKDLKQRGLLEDTLVVWCGEFGRMPMSEQGKGRDHNPWGYCGWLAGAGITGGRAYGATDPIGLRAAEQTVHVNQFHATLLHLLGLDHETLTYFHNGLDERLTGPAEVEIVKGLLT
ncbi:DUF1501 domain-containing protein [Gimesia chilikensis]|uniref:DUF1501 domain-containing protein n=1 Tax=Gimesia chilikensis TaxID=2605989 RepID=UPI0011EC4FBE|nr:DUF1501 domain-containing protein [Gimesia chilikensis]